MGEVSRIAHVSVRTLHHYDDTGVLKPSGRSDAGYRLYTDQDLVRLQQVLFYRELGFSLEEIREILADPEFDRREALLSQRKLVQEQIQRLTAVLGLIDKTMETIEGDSQMKKEEMFEMFGDFDPSDYEDEVQQRWGSTEAYRESARRTSRYTKQDWQRFMDESQEVGLAAAALMDAGVEPEDPLAMDAVDRMRLQIDRWFYPCSRRMHAELGKMYVADSRFAARYETIRPGMAQWICAATAANLAREAGQAPNAATE